MSRHYAYLKPVLLFVGLALLVPAAYALYLGEALWRAFLLTAVLLLAPGLSKSVASTARVAQHVWRAFFKKERIAAWNLSPEKKVFGEGLLTQSDAVVVAALSWIIIPLVTAVPYLAAGYAWDNAFFESMSGWTTTGLSFVQNVDLLPQSLLFYRSFTQWIGGVGIVLFALLVLRSPAASQLLRAESRDTVAFSVVQTTKIIWGIYLVLTLAGVAILSWVGLDVFAAVNLSMAALATGGFIPTNSLVLSSVQKVAFVLLMVWGGTAFTLHYAVWRREFQKLFDHTEFKVLLAGIVFFSVLMFFFAKESPENAAFHVVSAVTSTGYAVESLVGWSDFSKYLLILLMLSGACAGSTAGGIKLWRTVALLKTLVARVRRVFLPQGAVQVIKVNAKILKSDDVVESGTYIFLYLFVLTVAAASLMAIGLGGVDALFMTASAMGNAGLVSAANWSSFPLIGKAVLFVCMWLGRIEILPSLVLLRALRHAGE